MSTFGSYIVYCLRGDGITMDFCVVTVIYHWGRLAEAR